MSAPKDDNISQPQVIHILNETRKLIFVGYILLNYYSELYASFVSEGN